LAFKKNIFFLLIPFLLLVSCAERESSRTEFALGTVCSITLYDQGQKEVYDSIFSRIREIENLMSINIKSSDVSRINSNAGIEAVQVHEDTFKVIERAVYFARLSGGAIDPSVGPLVSLWGFGRENQNIPAQDKIDEILPLINWHNIKLDFQTRSVFLEQKGMTLDLGAIAKGYAADEAARIAAESGIKRALIDLGGNIVLLGERPDKNPWRVGIQNPGKDRGQILGVLHTRKHTVVTSGIYERFFEEDGRHYHHLFDPSNGYPAENGLLSATVITGNSMDADALSTAVFILGYEKGNALVNSLPSADAVFVFEDRSIRVTPGVNLILTDNSFTIKN